MCNHRDATTIGTFEHLTPVMTRASRLKNACVVVDVCRHLSIYPSHSPPPCATCKTRARYVRMSRTRWNRCISTAHTRTRSDAHSHTTTRRSCVGRRQKEPPQRLQRSRGLQAPLAAHRCRTLSQRAARVGRASDSYHQGASLTGSVS